MTTSKRALVRYADDFVIFAETREDADSARAANGSGLSCFSPMEAAEWFPLIGPT